MLTQEEAQQYLQAQQTSDWLQICLSAISADLPTDLQPAAYALLDRDENGKACIDIRSQTERELHQNIVTRNLLSLTALEPERRIAIFSSLVPRCASMIEATWQLLGHCPYQVGHLRRSFRAPGDDDAVSLSRTSWLKTVMRDLPSYRDKDIPWLAAWAAYLSSSYSPDLGLLCAAAIDAGGLTGTEVFDILLATAHGKHPTGKMGRHVTTALLSAARPDGWACIEQLLLAAQREEGLRQVILESVDNAHPQAFRRMLHLILDHDLLRFSAAVRAADVWLGFAWNVDDARAIHNGLVTILSLLDDSTLCQSFLSQGNPQQVYFALWTLAFADTSAAITAALPLLSDPLAERRLAATHLLGLLGLPTARRILVPLLADPDLRVALLAFHGIAQAICYDRDASINFRPASVDLFERLELLLPRLHPRTKTIDSGIWPWLTIRATASAILSTLLKSIGERSPTCLIPYLSLMDQWDRIRAARLLAALPTWDDTVCNTLYGLLGDRSSWVRKQALALVAQYQLLPQTFPLLETLLTRKDSALRRGVLKLLCKEADEHVLTSADRLLASSHALQRLAGLDLLHQLSSADRAVVACQEHARSYYQQRREALTPDEMPLLETILAIGSSTMAPARTRENVLGLISPADCSLRVAPREFAFDLKTSASLACLNALDALIEEHRSTPLLVKSWQGSLEVLLGNTTWQFSGLVSSALEAEDPGAHLPLAQVWRTWERARPAELRDSDGLEMLRGLLLALKQASSAGHGLRPAQSEVSASVETPLRLRLRYPEIISGLLRWLLHLQGITGAMLDFLLDIVETRLARISSESLHEELAQQAEASPGKYRHPNSRRFSVMEHEVSFSVLSFYMLRYPTIWTPAHQRRYWQILHWFDQPLPGLQRHRPPLEVLLAAYRIGSATEADILDQLGGPYMDYRYVSTGSADLSRISRRKPDPLFEAYPILQQLLPALRTRILELELERGEMPTPATRLALSLDSSGGSALFVRLLSLLSPNAFTRGYSRHDEARSAVFSHLLRISYPLPQDTPADFAHLVNVAQLDFKRLVAAAVYAPQWARFIEYALNWPHFEDAVWWISAHTKDSGWSIDEELRNVWQAQIAERTPLTAQTLLDGAVDVAWFWRCYTALGAERWEQLYAAAKYASSGTGHGRARLFADAMLGKIAESDLLQRINVKRMQDAVRALGLLPLLADDVASIHTHYAVLQEFLRSGRQFGVQRRASEKAAVSIGLENLARTAGYPDPIRLQWAMEAQIGSALRNGPLTVTVGDVRVTLALAEITALPSLSIIKGTSTHLKSLPTAIKKLPEIVALLDLKGEIEHQISRMRLSLETAMCRGDLFTAAELLELLTHPVLSRLLRNLVFLHHVNGKLVGYPQRKEQPNSPKLYFVSHDGSVVQIKQPTTALRLAHPMDLLESSTWSAWQHECFAAKRIQPFKQIFRELYVCTPNEMRNDQDALSWRYSGHQIQPKQALALLGQRGWIASYADGEVSRTFHSEGLVARLTFLYGPFTPTEIEGQTLEHVSFSRRDDWCPIPLTAVPPRLFSEVMRDLDMVVSVAASSSVDPEASTSTVEMRTTLIDEMCMLLGLQNVILKSAHALIEGKLGKYSVHLGSGIVHRQPGGALCIIPVHAQQRGRIFLPFADDDPKTAEIITKIITLACDQEIKDPSILAQLLRVG